MAQAISTEELKKKIDGGNRKFYLVDVLDEESFNTQHIPGSLSLPYNLYFVEKFSKKITPDKNADIVVYCAGERCESSKLAAELLEKAGYAKIIRYSGGLAGWQAAGYEFEKSGAGAGGR